MADRIQPWEQNWMLPYFARLYGGGPAPSPEQGVSAPVPPGTPPPTNWGPSAIDVLRANATPGPIPPAMARMGGGQFMTPDIGPEQGASQQAAPELPEPIIKMTTQVPFSQLLTMHERWNPRSSSFTPVPSHGQGEMESAPEGAGPYPESPASGLMQANLGPNLDVEPALFGQSEGAQQLALEAVRAGAVTPPGPTARMAREGNKWLVEDIKDLRSLHQALRKDWDRTVGTAAKRSASQAEGAWSRGPIESWFYDFMHGKGTTERERYAPVQLEEQKAQFLNTMTNQIVAQSNLIQTAIASTYSAEKLTREQKKWKAIEFLASKPGFHANLADQLMLIGGVETAFGDAGQGANILTAGGQTLASEEGITEGKRRTNIAAYGAETDRRAVGAQYQAAAASYLRAQADLEQAQGVSTEKLLGLARDIAPLLGGDIQLAFITTNAMANGYIPKELSDEIKNAPKMSPQQLEEWRLNLVKTLAENKGKFGDAKEQVDAILQRTVSQIGATSRGAGREIPEASEGMIQSPGAQPTPGAYPAPGQVESIPQQPLGAFGAMGSMLGGARRGLESMGAAMPAMSALSPFPQQRATAFQGAGERFNQGFDRSYYAPPQSATPEMNASAAINARAQESLDYQKLQDLVLRLRREIGAE